MSQLGSVTRSSINETPCFIVVTRPRKQLAGLIEQLAQGLNQKKLINSVVGLPLLEIEPIGDAVLAQYLFDSLQSADLIVFVSPNAVFEAKRLLQAFGHNWPTNCRVAVVGGGTEKAIKESGLLPSEIIKPANDSSWDSEGLWAALNSQERSWVGSKVVFIKGVGGRHWLSEKLEQAGATTIGIEVYKRVPLTLADPAWSEVEKAYKVANHHDQNAIPKALWLLTSSEAVQQIQSAFEKLGIPTEYLQQSNAICTHLRIRQAALEVGFGDVKLCDAGDLNLVNETIAILSNLKN